MCLVSIMIKPKYFSSSSSIPISFASVFLFSTLFAACCFTFLYLQPLQDHDGSDADHHLHQFNQNTKIIQSPSPTPIIQTNSSDFVFLGDDKDIDHQDDDPIDNQELLINSTTSVPNSTAEAPLMAELDEEPTGNDDASANSTGSVTTPMAVNSTINNAPLMNRDEVEKDLFKPPLNVSAEERMAWFKERLPRMKIFNSTKKSRRFDERIQEFFDGCKVRFFMTWISPRRSLFGKREFLSLETVLKAHPQGCVVIVSKSMDSKEGRDLVKPLVKLGHKVLLVDPDLSLLFTDTPAGPWLEGLKAGESDPGEIPITQNLTKLLRLVLLYKYGGIYLDADVIVIKDMSELRNCVGVQTVEGPGRIWASLSNAVLIFDQKHPLLLTLIKEFTTTFARSLRDTNNIISNVVKRVAFNESSYDFNIMSQNAFNPIERSKIGKYYRHPKDANETQWTYNEDFALKQQSYAIHLWNFVTRNFKIEQQSVVGRLFSDHCVLCQHVYDHIPSNSTSTS